MHITFSNFMINKIKILVFTLTILFISCVKPTRLENIENRHELELSIAKGITIPFANFDTVILIKSTNSYCGSPPPSQELLDKIYKPLLDSSIYLNEFRNNVKKTILISTPLLDDTFDTLMHINLKGNIDSVTRAENGEKCYKFFRNKVYVTTNGELVTNDTVKIHEQFWDNDKYITIVKTFYNTNGKWTSIVTDKTERKRKWPHRKN